MLKIFDKEIGSRDRRSIHAHRSNSYQFCFRCGGKLKLERIDEDAQLV